MIGNTQIRHRIPSAMFSFPTIPIRTTKAKSPRVWNSVIKDDSCIPWSYWHRTSIKYQYRMTGGIITKALFYQISLNNEKQRIKKRKRETRNEKRETRNEKRETRNEKRETRNEKRETINEKRETRNEKQETRN
jgi:hypothetical protein